MELGSKVFQPENLIDPFIAFALTITTITLSSVTVMVNRAQEL